VDFGPFFKLNNCCRGVYLSLFVHFNLAR